MADLNATHQAELKQLQDSAESMKNELQADFQKQLDNREATMRKMME